MSRRIAYGLIVIAFIVGGIAGVLGYTWTVGGSGKPSEPISAPTLSLNPTEAPPDMVGTKLAQMDENLVQVQAGISDLATQIAQLSDSTNDDTLVALATQAAYLSAQVDSLVTGKEATPILLVFTPGPTFAPTMLLPTEVPTEAPTDMPTAAAADSAAARTLYRITPDQSEVSFTLNEELQGNPTTVVGTTNQVAGDVIVDFANPADSQLGTIRINARTLATNNEFRNRAIRAQILESARDEYEFINFVPTALSGLPESAAVGDTLTFQITGDLTIRNITKPVTFDATLTISDTVLQGSATATVLRSDFNLQIPDVPGVANVTQEVALQIDFTAQKVDE
jgi:polyisoprenoid-binding protein YceI